MGEDYYPLAGHKSRWGLLEAYQLEALQALGLKPEHQLLDVGCGPLRGGVPFIQYLDPGHYTGIDPSVEACSAAGERILDLELDAREPIIDLGTISDYPETVDLSRGPFDFILLFAVLQHLEDDEVKATFRNARPILADGGQLVASVIAGPYAMVAKWRGFPTFARRRRTYTAWAAEAGFTMRRTIEQIPGTDREYLMVGE